MNLDLVPTLASSDLSRRYQPDPTYHKPQVTRSSSSSNNGGRKSRRDHSLSATHVEVSEQLVQRALASSQVDFLLCLTSPL